jgi:hypothetical protein
MMATIAAGVAVAIIHIGAAEAAEECVATPKAETPAGAHWYYRVEAGSKRHCWYLSDASKAPARAAKSATSRVTVPESVAAAPKALPRSTADARAEWRAPESATENGKQLNDGDQNKAPLDKELTDDDRYTKKVAVLTERLTSAAPPDGSAQVAPVVDSASPDRSPQVWFPQVDSVAASGAAPPAPISTAALDIAPVKTDASPDTPVASAAITAAELDNSPIGTVSFLIGLASITLGALIFLGLSIAAIYRRAEGQTDGPGDSGFDLAPPFGAPPSTQPALDVDDNLHRMREMLARLQQEAEQLDEGASAFVPQR